MLNAVEQIVQSGKICLRILIIFLRKSSKKRLFVIFYLSFYRKSLYTFTCEYRTKNFRQYIYSIFWQSCFCSFGDDFGKSNYFLTWACGVRKLHNRLRICWAFCDHWRFGALHHRRSRNGRKRRSN